MAPKTLTTITARTSSCRHLDVEGFSRTVNVFGVSQSIEDLCPHRVAERFERLCEQNHRLVGLHGGLGGKDRLAVGRMNVAAVRKNLLFPSPCRRFHS
ncbi:MAG: hypothetical protein ACT4P5_04290 [Armatimonadota bacterium]